MGFKVWLKTNAADKVLAPLRTELVEQFEPNNSVLDIGCGTGDLLFKAASKISNGVGVDLDPDMIKFAKEKALQNSLSNLRFECLDACNLETKNYDIATATLCLHEMPEVLACKVLSSMAQSCRRVIIADYSRPESRLAGIGIELDEMISGHYSRFRKYKRAGTISEYARKCRLQITQTTISQVDGILIWEIAGSTSTAS